MVERAGRNEQDGRKEKEITRGSMENFSDNGLQTMNSGNSSILFICDMSCVMKMYLHPLHNSPYKT